MPAPVVPEPFELATLPWESQPGRWSLSICLRGSFSLVHGGECEPLEPLSTTHTVDGSWDEAQDKILHLADLAPFKPRADVLVIGHAFAPWGAPVRALTARVRVGTFTKAVRVVGDRTWRWVGQRWVAGEPRPFTSMRLRWEGAARSPAVPVGIDPGAPPVEGSPAGPTFEPVGDALPGLGPIPPGWPQRYGLVDESALEWALSFAGGGPVEGTAPPRFPFQFFNVAPADQQMDLVRPGAPLVLEHLSPRHPMIATHLPMARPRVSRIQGGRRTEVALKCDTLWIDTDREAITMLWRGLVDVEGPHQRPELAIAIDGLTSGAHRASSTRQAPPAAAARLEQTQDVPIAAVDRAMAALPFGGAAPDEDTSGLGDEGSTTAAGQRIAAPPQPVAPQPVAPRPAALQLAPPPPPPRPVTVPPPASLAPLTVVEPGPPQVVAIDPESIDLPGCAAIAADLARPGSERALVLGERGLDEPGWARVDRRWKQAIDQDARKGSTALLEAYDDAFLEALGKRSSPIGVAEYARINVAQKRGDLAAVLEDLGFPRIELLRLTRVWTRRAKSDAALAQELKAAVDAAEKR